jgi:hypothetical protein
MMHYIKKLARALYQKSVTGQELSQHVPTSNKLLRSLTPLSLCGSKPFRSWPFISLLILHTVSRTPWTGNKPVARPLPTRRTQTQNKLTQTSLPRVKFEHTTLVFEWAKTVQALKRGRCDRPALFTCNIRTLN